MRRWAGARKSRIGGLLARASRVLLLIAGNCEDKGVARLAEIKANAVEALPNDTGGVPLAGFRISHFRSLFIPCRSVHPP